MKVGRIHGIDVQIHWTFWLLILFYLFLAAKSGRVIEGLAALAFVLTTFLCVLLHEFGHALAARRFGIRTHDITLMPIGGLARLERMPENPKQELVVAIAGPMVNLVIAAGLSIFVIFDFLPGWPAPAVFFGGSFLGQLMAVNLFLVLFNMLPAFPMDGGRVLRSLLAMKFGFVRATQYAARLGRWMSLAFVLWGIWTLNPLLIILAIFVFATGTIELLQVKLRSMQGPNGQSMQSESGSFWASAGWQTGSRTESNPSPDGEIIDAVDFRKIR